jgi:2-Cys peroxiredoxin 5
MMNTTAFAARRLALNGVRGATRSFHSSRPAFVKVGDAIPDLNVLAEGSPGNKVNLAEEIGSGKALIIGVPAAFSKCCPSYRALPVTSYPVAPMQLDQALNSH